MSGSTSHGTSKKDNTYYRLMLISSIRMHNKQKWCKGWRILHLKDGMTNDAMTDKMLTSRGCTAVLQWAKDRQVKRQTDRQKTDKQVNFCVQTVNWISGLSSIKDLSLFNIIIRTGYTFVLLCQCYSVNTPLSLDMSVVWLLNWLCITSDVHDCYGKIYEQSCW